ncbi:PRE-binding protein, putative (PREBP) [Plasmodium ovale wallikeri]|uniref:PRE-binding protein, putative n=2 Tax=Plasmodium ovale TaxID=36330 RepID=A0A1C3KRE9_PLAOA|nr:PRE-binding protein, putative (PREBP) [Plasmodium ovale wallikeri]SBT34586.1 PRE-binding protein, putative (PREBP) [Plasmodium ovale wallikeri]SBT76687.1 PRE-binding protein, putative [Plasmodium ovale]
MHFITKMGRKAKAAATGTVEKKAVNDNVASGSSAKDNTSNDKKHGGSKLNEKNGKNENNDKNDKKVNGKGTELTTNVQINGNVQNKKDKDMESKKINNVEENCIIKNKDNNKLNNKEDTNNTTSKKKKANKNQKKEEGLNKNNEDTTQEKSTSENSTPQAKGKNAKKNEELKKKGKNETEVNSRNSSIHKDAKKDVKKDVKKDAKKDAAKGATKDATNEVKKEDPKKDATNEAKKEDPKKDMKKDLKLKEDERKKIENELNKKFLKLTKQDNYKNINDKIEGEEKRKNEFEALIGSINTSISKINAQTARPINMKMSSADVENKCKEAKLKKKKINPKSEEEVEEVNTYINYLEEQLYITKNYESFKNFQNRLITLKKSCEEKLKENVKSLNDIKVQEKKLRFVDKIIKMKKEKQNVVVKETDIVNKEFSLTNDKYSSLIKPYNFLNRIQNKYFVYIDKVSNNNFENKVSLLLSGCKEDIENFISHLKNIDFTEKNYVNLSNRVFKIMINMCEGSFKKMEEDTNVFIHIDNETLYYCGMKDDVETLKELIEKATTNEKNSSTKNISKNIKLDSVLARGFNKGLLKEIENKTNTSIRINYDAQTFEASATIRGNKNTDIDEAEEKLNEILKNLETEFVEFEEREIFALYKRCAYELNDIRMNLNLFVIRHDNGISLVGKRENITKALEILDYAKNVISNKSVKKKLTEEEAFLFNANFRNHIKTQTGAEVKIFNKLNYKELNISGNKNDIDNAIEMVEELLKKKKCVEVELNEKVIAVLLSAKAQKIKEIEKDTSTSIQINKSTYVAQIYGHEDSIHLAKDILENLVQTEVKDNNPVPNNLYITVEMTVDTEYIGSIIGKKGRTINKIQEDTFAKKIHIDKETKKVFIHGTQKTVEAAQKEILKILKRSKEENSYNMDRSKYPNSSTSPYRKTYKSANPGRSNYRSNSSKNGVYINMNDEKAFPSLHDVSTMQTKKTKKAINQANQKKQEESQLEVNNDENK